MYWRTYWVISIGGDPMPYDRFRHHRRTLRLRGYDYTRAAAYFVTIRTAESGDVLGTVVEGSVVLNDIGRLVEECWQALPDAFRRLRLDDFVIMPDHLHGIVILPHGVPVRRVSSAITNEPHAPSSFSPPPGSLGCVIGSFKSAASKMVNRALAPKAHPSGKAIITNASSATTTNWRPSAVTSPKTRSVGGVIAIPSTRSILRPTGSQNAQFVSPSGRKIE